ASGFYDVNFFERDTIYFEASYATRNSVGRFTDEQVFPGVPALIPLEDANGNLLVNPDGSLQLFDNPLNPFDADALPVYSLEGLSQRRKSDVDVFRFVGGMEGDLPFLMDRNWVYDVSLAYDRSYGTASQPIMREDGIREALDTLRLDASGNPICGLDRNATSFGFLTPTNCPAIDFFNPSLFTVLGGDRNFATQEETDFLFGQAINITEMEQVHAQAIFTGDVFEMPAGTVGLVLGMEFREQRINSINDVSRVLGTAASEIPDTERPTIGRTSLYELFAETELPITDNLLFSLSGRFTEHETFGAHMTYSGKFDWQVTDSFRLRSTYGTSFRAPNLREQFLAGATGTISGANDPCLVPATANNGGVYDPNGETRSQLILDNCVAAGADPTALGLLATTGITTSTGGNPNATAETSESLTFGGVFQHSFANDIDLDVSVTYFDIQIEDTLEESNAATILANCYGNQPNLADPSCARITRNTGDPTTATVALVDASFINIGQLTSTGIDYNVRASMPLSFVDDQTDLVLSFNAAQYLEQLRNQDPSDPNSIEEDLIGRIASPEWLWQFSATATRGNWAARWRTRYQGEGQQENSDALVQTDLTRAVPRTACEQLGYAGQCRDVDFVDSYMTHDLSLSYDADMWSFSAGVNNITDEQPPLIDQGEGPARMNMVVQSGYDLIGRRAFASITRRF
ncbi:MAG: TonB-dependent receptor, partial [Pseudomonadota bacterium]|nr:TonB-dependent receptor [Pseudomonadota bacterium]